MKKSIAGFLLVFVPFSVAVAQSPLDKLKEKIGVSNSSNLSDDKVVSGLKEALKVSTGKAVAKTGRPDGYLKNQAIKILLPPKLQTVGKGLRMIGRGSQVDELEVGMNRAAEQAAPEAKAIFLRAVTKMTFDDARKILTGGSDTAATEYFKRTSSPELTKTFAPIVHKSMEKVGVVQQYNQLMQNSIAAPLAKDKSFSLDDYIVAKALDGLFYMLGEEEKKIRKDPAAQTTALLKEVFGGLRK